MILGATYSPQIIYSYPEPCLCAEAVPDFCIPAGVTVAQCTPPSPIGVSAAGSPHPGMEGPGLGTKRVARLLSDLKEMVFVLSGGGADGSDISYGMCLHARRTHQYSDKIYAQVEICYCFISQYPFLPLHLGVLREIVRIHLSPDAYRKTKPGEDLELERQSILRITEILNRCATCL